MTTAADERTEDDFLQIVSAICAADTSLNPLGAALLAANYLGIAKDTRTFARKLGVEHALVLREITALDQHGGFLTIAGRNARTQRLEFVLTGKGTRLAALACD